MDEDSAIRNEIINLTLRKKPQTSSPQPRTTEAKETCDSNTTSLKHVMESAIQNRLDMEVQEDQEANEARKIIAEKVDTSMLKNVMGRLYK